MGVALVTGGTRGIGLAIAQGLLKAGHSVSVLARNTPSGTAWPDDRRLMHVRGDARRIDDLRHYVAATVERFGPVGILVNNVGAIAPRAVDILDVPQSDFDDAISTNLRAGFFLTQIVARQMIETVGVVGAVRDPNNQCAPTIVFITSSSAAMPSSVRAAYGIAKAGASMMTQLFAQRLAPHGIAVYEVRPGPIARTSHETDSWARRRIPVGEYPTADDVMKIVTSVISLPTIFATGTVIKVDGGLEINRLE